MVSYSCLVCLRGCRRLLAGDARAAVFVDIVPRWRKGARRVNSAVSKIKRRTESITVKDAREGADISNARGEESNQRLWADDADAATASQLVLVHAPNWHVIVITR